MAESRDLPEIEGGGESKYCSGTPDQVREGIQTDERENQNIDKEMLSSIYKYQVSVTQVKMKIEHQK